MFRPTSKLARDVRARASHLDHLADMATVQYCSDLFWIDNPRERHLEMATVGLSRYERDEVAR